MRFREFKIILEAPGPTIDELESMKAVIASKIRELPDDDATAKALKEIEELLQHVNAGGRMGMIYDQLEQINDPSVLAAQKMLARYILSIESSPEERKQFFQMWKADEIVNMSKLLSKKRMTFANIFNGYGKNRMVTEFVDDVMSIDALGHGKGEFGLNVLSKNIWKPEDNKGDLKMNYDGRTWQIECKTTDGGAARFGDQEVRPAEGFEQAAIALNTFVTKNKTYPMKLSGSGMNLNQAIEFHQNIKPTDKSKFMGLVRRCLTLIFGRLVDARPEQKKRLLKNVNEILSAIEVGASGKAAQAYSQASFNYYMSKKHDDGVLYTNLTGKSFMFYDNAADLTAQGLRFHASTPYLSATKDPVRSVYPQLDVVQSTFGGTQAAKTLPKVTRKTSPEDMAQSTYNWAESFANARGVRNSRTIASMAKVVQTMLPSKPKGADVIAELERQFPQLKAPTASVEEPEEIVQQAPVAPQSTTPVAPQPTTPIAPQPAV
jgi:hypothetical protein